MSDIPRRTFVTLAAGVAACACLPSCGHVEHPNRAHGPVDVGPLTRYRPRDGILVTDHWAESGGFLLVQTVSRLYAVSSECTHRGCTVETAAPKNGLRCPCHGSEYAVDGRVTKGPASKTLPRFAISVDPTGRVVVDAARSFSEAEWSNPASFVAL